MGSRFFPTPRPEPSQRALRCAYLELRTLHWPDTLEAALARPHFCAALRHVARKYDNPPVPLQPHQRRPAHSLPTGPVPPTPTPDQLRTGHGRSVGSLSTEPQRPLGTWTKVLPMTGRVDLKRLAGNDKDDD